MNHDAFKEQLRVKMQALENTTVPRVRTSIIQLNGVIALGFLLRLSKMTCLETSEVEWLVVKTESATRAGTMKEFVENFLCDFLKKRGLEDEYLSSLVTK